MVIRFACTHCGQGYSVPDEYWGSPFKCKHCGARGTVPGQPELEGRPGGRPALEPDDTEETSAGIEITIKTGSCPNCQWPVTEDTILCVNCGLNLRTGLMPGEEPPQEEVAPDRPKVDMRPLIKALVLGGVALVGLIAVAIVFFTLVRPMLTASALDDIRELAKRGHLLEAADRFEKIAPKVAAEDRPKVERMGAIVRKQSQMIDLDPTSVGDVVLQGYFAGTEGKRLQRLVMRTLVKNDSKEPVELGKECFYLFGSGCISFPWESQDDPWPKVVVAPGDTGEVTLQFTAVPGPGIGLLAANPTAPVYLVYNDGVNYTSRPVNLLSILD
jgi:hypothetical protein